MRKVCKGESLIPSGAQELQEETDGVKRERVNHYYSWRHECVKHVKNTRDKLFLQRTTRTT